jgi:thioredoxin 1
MIKVFNDQDFNAELKKNNKVLALFYASWCPYCTRFVLTFDKETSTLSFNSVIHVLLDDNDNPLWNEYDIPAVPTIIFFENGKICKRLDGKLGIGLNEGQFRTWIEEFK